MRVIPLYEQKQRGCPYCKHVTLTLQGWVNRTACPYEECPFTVLDNYRSYDEYMKSDDCMLSVDEFFKSVPGFCNFTQSGQTPRHEFSDGDGRVDL